MIHPTNEPTPCTVIAEAKAGTLSSRQEGLSAKPHASSKLDLVLHNELAHALKPARAFYVTVVLSLLGAFQFGWLLCQLSYKQFHVKQICQLPVKIIAYKFPDYCIMFRGHTQAEWTMVTTAWIVGGGVGALFSGYPADRFGRKATIGLNAFIMIAGAVVQVTSTSIYDMAGGRFVSGVASGAAINVANVLISGIAPRAARSFYLTSIQIAISLGALVVTSAHYGMTTDEYTWRLLVAAPVLIGVLQLALLPFMVESPVWFVAKGRSDLARRAIARLYLPTSPGATDAVVAAMEAARAEEDAEAAAHHHMRWTILFTAKYRKQLLVSVILAAMQQLCGINAFMYYSVTIFTSVGINDPRYANSIINAARLQDFVQGARRLDRYNRRTLLLGGMSLMVFAGIGLVVSLANSSNAATPYTSVACMVMFVAAYCFSIGPLSWIIPNELFPDFLKARAGAFSTLSTWFCNFFVGVYFQQMADPANLGNYAFLVFTGITVLAIIFVYFCVPETNQKSYYEILHAFGVAEKAAARVAVEPQDNQGPDDGK
ncbi:Aste57867_12024 [Aphanomyces stellatus]|uniref:Hexose transporter 1 n=1 Tax=Aphanomyces stellatus TaxID=120398 RepID=A0A485KUF8_9STRA|nr:hypothetical protein As57867_011979 [Aphanomyces stellatus]VFT88879.1 Aste57867_12024 [Aphanomyces stellatus]